MDKTFIDAMSYLTTEQDSKSVSFLSYILKKYFNNQNCFMKLKEATPFLEKNDEEQLQQIVRDIGF